ncbi:MAG: 4Fe-4S dicluster domain-containing protein [Dehalococcoidales bacterium]|nr:4Fe-4S dicluster domain-containing protein [Dehalococcoidales bacterium]
MIKVNSEFLNSIKWSDEFNASACINCGSCTALCPVGINLLPRLLFRYVLIGALDKVLENTENIYSCLLCKMCEENCPANVSIAENIRTLRVYINRNIFEISRS